jgi:hypothetical protein
MREPTVFPERRLPAGHFGTVDYGFWPGLTDGTRKAAVLTLSVESRCGAVIVGSGCL